MKMYRYSIKIYGYKNLFRTISIEDNRLIDDSRYIQFLGLYKLKMNKNDIISFRHLKNLDLNSLKGYKICLLNRKGIAKSLSTPIKEIKMEEI